MTYVPKHHDSCVRVLEFLKLLMQKDIDIKDISQSNIDLFQDIEATETFLKYISTLEMAGINVFKVGKKYSLGEYINNLNFAKQDILNLIKIYETFDFTCVESQRKYLNNFFEKIKKMVSENEKINLEKFIQKYNKVKENALSVKSEEYQKYIDLEQKMQINYDGEIFIAEPKKVEIEGQNVYLTVYYSKTAEIRKLLTDKIGRIEILPLKSSSLNMTSAVVFEVYDGLSVNYRLRDCEHLQYFDDNKKIIINSGEDRKLLLKRLMKYGENCKIISPKCFKESFVKELEKMNEKLQGVSV